MAWTSIFAIYFILWWVVLFAVLPWGNQSLHETGKEVGQGHASSAPVKPNLALKFIVTTLVSAVIFAVGYTLVSRGIVTMDNIPFVPDYGY